MSAFENPAFDPVNNPPIAQLPLVFSGQVISSFPIHSNGHELEIVQGLPINEFSRAKIDLTVNELKEEKAMVKELLQG